MNDDWDGHPQYLDPDTRYPHRCPHNPMFNTHLFEYSFQESDQNIDPNNELLCREHGLLLIHDRYPKQDCSNQGWIKRGYYNDLKEKGLL
ncbi:MAG: hypothetical protein ACREAK_11345 [Nitrosarchaeum sp.]